ncbi:MAG TPA: hypothetical protein VGN20_13420 [Mucilaginibacter sp.]|jgi:hypothetical protein
MAYSQSLVYNISLKENILRKDRHLQSILLVTWQVANTKSRVAFTHLAITSDSRRVAKCQFHGGKAMEMSYYLPAI